MKKIGLLLSVLMFSVFASIALAQDVGGISVMFCNDEDQTKNLSLITDAGVDSEICMDFANSSESDMVINYGFVDGTVTADQNKYKACKNEGDVEKFGQYVTQDTNEILVPAMQIVRQKAHVKFPAGLSGLVNGCLTYYVKDSNTDGSMFNVLIRKASFIDVLVGGDMRRGLKLSDTEPVSYVYDKNTKEYTVFLSLDNVGNVDELVSLSGTISNNFGYSADISLVEEKILSDSNSKIQLNVGKIPRYKMTYNINLNVISNPSFIFSPDLVPDDLKEPTTMNIALSIFVFPWVLVYIIAGLLVLVLIIRFLAKHLSFK